MQHQEISQNQAMVAERLPAMEQASRGRQVIAQSEAWRHLVAGGRYWSLGDHMKFWIREEHMNPRWWSLAVAGRPNPEIHVLFTGFT
ncbi:hypothetical protein QL285_092745 [Trifolium repens]|nr:hypothetical protein QL285_092745 [Trifolium repens]